MEFQENIEIVSDELKLTDTDILHMQLYFWCQFWSPLLSHHQDFLTI